ncbi:hypothetical protein FHS15_005797 [Paenibacillus castaneae]|uniref:hypothetical protein n=1 Tax=Paenibacillus castaneae TaxID=474957 RepID=UPI00141B47E7|nr:hypothetical protein [Paenibacillus castaneae]NIK80606.1 hypothetical protein [Paenibacillus castaneae]
MQTLAAAGTIDLAPVGDAIVANFQANLPVISTVAGIMIGAAVVYRWIKRASK